MRFCQCDVLDLCCCERRCSGSRFEYSFGHKLVLLALFDSFGSLLAYSAYVWLLKVRPAAEVGTHAYVNPFIAVLLGVSFGNEQVTFVQLSGLLVILLGVMLISRKRNKMKSTAISR